MKPYALIRQQLLRAQRYQAYRRIYRGSCMHSAYASSDRCLLAVLVGGMLLIGLPALQHVFWAAQTQVPDQPPPMIRGNKAIMPLLTEIDMQAKNADSVFKPAKQPLQQAFSPEHSTQTAKPTRAANAAVPYIRLWRMQILRPPATAQLSGKVADGYRHLQNGQLPLARLAFLTALARDSHNVEAMQGMLLLARQAGDSQAEADYLERLRLEIPYYEHEPASQTDQDQGQG